MQSTYDRTKLQLIIIRIVTDLLEERRAPILLLMAFESVIAFAAPFALFLLERFLDLPLLWSTVAFDFSISNSEGQQQMYVFR